jgi:hypothetical protein
MDNVLSYIQSNWYNILAWLIIADEVIKNAAEKKGYTKIVSVCDHLGNVLSFIMDIVVGLFIKQPPRPPAGGAAIAAVLIAFCLLGSGVARADIFHPLGVDNSKLTATTPVIDSGSILQDASTIINYLGLQEGYAYNFELKQWDVVSGTTIVTYAPWNIDLGVAMLDTDGVEATLDWNIGAYLPVANVPIMQYCSYLYLSGGFGAEENSSGAWKIAPTAGIKAKFTFGPQ